MDMIILTTGLFIIATIYLVVVTRDIKEIIKQAINEFKKRE